MSLGIVCGCEGLLGKQGTVAFCVQCRKTYPLEELEQVLKLLTKANYEPASPEQTPPSEQEKRTALNIAARKLARLQLRVVELEEDARSVPPPPPPRPQAPVPYPTPSYTGTSTTTTWASNNTFGRWVYVRVTIG